MTHTDPADRPSRKGWPDNGPAPEPEYAPAVHDHQLQPGLRLALIALSIFVLLLSLGMIGVATYAYQDHEYVQGRGEVRDRENEQLNERITDEVHRLACQMLDSLPAGPLLDPMRAEYGCGPGIPVEDLPAEVQSNLQKYADGLPLATDNDFDVNDYYADSDDRFAPPEASYDRARPRQDSPETTDAPSSSPALVPPSMAPTQPPVATPVPTSPAPTSAPPLVDVGGLTDAVCESVGICL